MIDIYVLLVGYVLSVSLIGALMARGMGGWFGFGKTQPGRVVYVVVLAALVAPFSYIAAAASLLMWPGATMPHGIWQDMGRVDGKGSDDFLGMSGKEALSVYIPATIMAAIDPWFGMVVIWSGPAVGPVYLLAWRFETRIRPVRLLGRYLIDGPTSIGELGRGAIRYGTMASLAAWMQWLAR